jgi:membrane protein implicated in regulation of membrane protease activity
MNTPPDNKRDLSGPLSIVVLLLLLLAVIGVFLWWLLPTPKSVAAFGDAFGGVAGTLVSGFALVLLVFTVLQQQRALKLQREELRDTREELKGSRKAQEGSEKALQAQVKVAQLTARLNAALALIAYYDDLISTFWRTTTESELAWDHERKLEELKASRAEVQNDLFHVRNELIGAVRIDLVVQRAGRTVNATAQVSDPKDELSG